MTQLEETLKEAAEETLKEAAEETLKEAAEETLKEAAEVKAETTHTIEEQHASALGRAIAYWQSGSYIPMTLAAELMAEGYDVTSLEARHLKD